MQPSSDASIVRASLCKKIELVRQLFRTFHEKERGLRAKTNEEAETGKKREPVDILAKTEFEEVGVAKRPAVSLVRKKSSVRWKRKPSGATHDKPTKEGTGKKKDSEPTKKDEKQSTDVKDVPITDVIQHREFRLARKIIDEVHKAKMMEKLLNEQDTAIMRKFIENDLANPSYKAKARFLDVMLVCPSTLPNSWGGRHICEITDVRPGMLITSASTPDEASVVPPPIAESFPSPWTKIVKGMMDENKLKISLPSLNAEKHSSDTGQRIEDTGLTKTKVRKSKSVKKEERKGREESADEEKRRRKDDLAATKHLHKPMQRIDHADKQPLKCVSSADLEKKTGESALKETKTRDYDQVNTKELMEYLLELDEVKGNTYIENQKKKEVQNEDEPHGIESFIELYSLKNGDEVKKKQATRRSKSAHEKKPVHEISKSEKHEHLKSLAKTQDDVSLKEHPLKEHRDQPLESPKLRVEKKEVEVKKEVIDGSFKKADIKGLKVLDDSQPDIQKQQKEKGDKIDGKGKLDKEGDTCNVKEVDAAGSLKTSSSKTSKIRKEEDSRKIGKEGSFKSDSKKGEKFGKPLLKEEKSQDVKPQRLKKEDVDRGKEGIVQGKTPAESKSPIGVEKTEEDSEEKTKIDKVPDKTSGDAEVKREKLNVRKEQDKKVEQLGNIPSETKIGGDIVAKQEDKKGKMQKDKEAEAVARKVIDAKEKSATEKKVKEEVQEHKHGEDLLKKTEGTKIDGQIDKETQTQQKQKVHKQKVKEEQAHDITMQKEKTVQEQLDQEKKTDEAKKLHSEEKMGDGEDTGDKEKKESQQGQVKEIKKVDSKENLHKEKGKEHGFRKFGSKDHIGVEHKQPSNNATKEKLPVHVVQRVRKSKDSGKHVSHQKEEHKKEIKERKFDSKRQEDKTKDLKVRRKKSTKKE
ncbi:hypothetical protein ANCCEY_10849 [Ancylostoma ceylanicum]|uniref:Uncharacterized protein n=1 Tax=Ancylostoma ceylanicum TaxID=53326 RepID=A0A0D6LQX9_9BILA|nr:hypothetical protein ANCCEY_10849 [Ancylostoma ceylanicum]